MVEDNIIHEKEKLLTSKGFKDISHYLKTRKGGPPIWVSKCAYTDYEHVMDTGLNKLETEIDCAMRFYKKNGAINLLGGKYNDDIHNEIKQSVERYQTD